VKRSMDLWAARPDADLYRTSAAARYGIAEAAVDSVQRQLAKIEELGLGFGSGADTFRKVAKTMSGGEINLAKEFRHATQAEIDAMPGHAWDTDADGYAIVYTRDPAQESVDSWRERYPEIVAGWALCDAALRDIFHGTETTVDPWGLVRTSKEGFVLPGYIIRYPHLRQEAKEDKFGRQRQQWVYGEGRHQAGIYGSKADENIVQSLARNVIADYSIDFYRETGMRPALRPYDELVYVADEDRAEEHLATLLRVMRTPVKWWPELTVWAEGSIGDTYGDAK